MLKSKHATKRATSLTLAVLFFIPLFQGVLPRQAAAAEMGKLILMQTSGITGTFEEQNMVFTLEEVSGDHASLPITSDDGSSHYHSRPRDIPYNAQAFKDASGVILNPMTLSGRYQDKVRYQTGNIAFNPVYHNTSGSSNNAGYWIHELDFKYQMPSNTTAKGSNSLVKNDGSPLVDGWDYTTKGKKYYASGSTPSEYAASIRGAYEQLVSDSITNHWWQRTFEIPVEVQKALNEGKDVYVLGYSEYMCKDNTEVTINNNSTDDATVTVKTRLNPNIGKTNQTVSSAVFGGGGNYVPYNLYWMHFEAYNGGKFIGRASYAPYLPGIIDQLDSVPNKGAGTFDVSTDGGLITTTGTLGKEVNGAGSAYLYSDATRIHTDYHVGIFYFLADFKTDTELSYLLTATPKEKEVAGSPGTPATLGENVTVTLDLNQSGISRDSWKTRLTRVINVDVYLKITAPDGRILMCDTNHRWDNPSGNGIPLEKEEFLELLNKKLVFTDTVNTKTISSAQTIRYDYTAELVVEFEENGVGETVRVTATSAQDTDYASFFRKKDPPPLEYLKYTSNPTTFSELKQGTIGNEAFEAMAGVPSTRSLYFAVGGSEFIVDFDGVIRKEQTAQRTYHVHYDGCECEFKQGDQAKSFSFPLGNGSGSTTVSSMHDGGSCTVTWTGTTPWTGSGGVNGATATVTNSWDDSSYNNALATAQAYANTVNGTVYSYTSASDKQTRSKSGWGASASGSNPHISGTATQGQEYVAPTYEDVLDKDGKPTGEKKMTDPGKPFVAGQYSPGQSNSWTITVSWSIPAHTCCGPCCSHDLPAVDDTWTQEIKYDYLDFSKAVVWRLEQGKLTGMGTITGGTSSYTADILQGAPSVFYNIAASETSRDGRFRYSLAPEQHDDVTWNKGIRSNKCNKQNESYGTGIVYSNLSYPHQAGYPQSQASAKDKATPEYAEFVNNRETLVTATVISDFLILQTSSGDQAVVYYDKQSNAVKAEGDFSPVTLTKSEVWDNNLNSASDWSPYAINIGSYNGNYAEPANKFKGTGNGNRVATVFDNDPAKTITRPARPTAPLYVTKYAIPILATLPNDQYDTGMASAVWKTVLNYNPDGDSLPYTTSVYSRNAPYSSEHSKINDIVVHNPVSSEYAMILSLDDLRDQRSDANKSRNNEVNNLLAGAFSCPGTPENCEHRVLDCHYQGTTYHTVNCYTSAQPYTNNTHYHSVACVDNAKIQQAFTRVPIETSFSFSGSQQVFEAPYSGTYTLEVWGAQGDFGGGLGGYAKGTVYLSKGETVYVYVGGQNGYNGGGSPGTGRSGGGGTDIRKNGTSLSNRIIVAGGGGAYQYLGNTSAGTGGAVGGDGSYHPEVYSYQGRGATAYAGGSVSGNAAVYGATSGSFGVGGNHGVYHDGHPGGGGGGGYYGGSGSTWHAGAGGGSSYVGGVDNGDMISGVQSGNGLAKISYNGVVLYGDIWGLVDFRSLDNGSGVYTVTTEWLAKQPYNSQIFKCGSQPYNIHVCNASCNHTSKLVCNEPHHTGGHYDLDSPNCAVCWSACNNHEKHMQKMGGVVGSAAASQTAAGFINLDWGFQVYFPNIGDFWQGGVTGIPALTTQRGKGFTDAMDTTEWVKTKRVKFGFDVIFCGSSSHLNANGSQHGNTADGSDNHKHTSACVFTPADTWITLDIKYQLFNFYIPSAIAETASAEVSFEAVAINAPSGNDNTLAANRLRNTVFQAKHGALKFTYIDIVGRIGNLILSDTGDYRFSNLFKNPVEPPEWYIENVVPKVDLSSKNFVLTEPFDIRGLVPLSSIGQNTYGFSPWLSSKLLLFSLSPEKNNISQFKKEPLRAGYDLFMSVDTIGKGVREVVVEPYYYWFDPLTGTVYPLDVYMEGYQPVNLFGQQETESYHTLVLKWNSEYLRRNVTEEEYTRTKTLSNIFPTGDYTKLGTAQQLILDERTRTFVGSAYTMGVNQNKNGIPSSDFEMSIKRWHFTLGLPSSAFVVGTGEDPTSDSARNRFKNMTGAILMTAKIYSISDSGFTLEHSLPGSGNVSIGGVSYPIPTGLPAVIGVINGKYTSRDDVTITQTH